MVEEEERRISKMKLCVCICVCICVFGVSGGKMIILPWEPGN